MGKHVVNVPEYAVSSRQLKTAGQWLAEFKQLDRSEKSRVMIFPAPLSVVVSVNDTLSHEVLTVRTSTALFALFRQLAHDKGVISRITWKGFKIGPKGLFELNRAIQTSATRKGGISIVRHWLENVRGSLTATRSDFPALLSYLEIRPIPTRSSVLLPQTLSIMSNVALDISGKTKGRKKGRKRPLPKCKSETR